MMLISKVLEIANRHIDEVVDGGFCLLVTLGKCRFCSDAISDFLEQPLVVIIMAGCTFAFIIAAHHGVVLAATLHANDDRFGWCGTSAKYSFRSGGGLHIDNNSDDGTIRSSHSERYSMISASCSRGK